MWNKIKTFLAWLGGIVIAVFSVLLGKELLHHRESASGVGEDSEGPTGTIESAERAIRESREARRQLDETTRRLEETNGRFGEILSEIRENQQVPEDSSSGM